MSGAACRSSAVLKRATSSGEDLTNRFAAAASYPEQLIAHFAIVLMDGSALPDAEVTLIPEKFMGEGRKPLNAPNSRGRSVGACRYARRTAVTRGPSQRGRAATVT